MPVDTLPELIVLGRFGPPQGVAGWVRVVSYTHPPDNIGHYQPWLVVMDGVTQALDVAALKARNQGFVVRVDGVTDRDQAERLTGHDIMVPRSALPEPEDPGEFYWRDLIGMAVTNDDGKRLGVVRSLLDTGAHDVLVVEGPGGDCLIPFVAAFVLAVDREAGVIQVSWLDPV